MTKNLAIFVVALGIGATPIVAAAQQTTSQTPPGITVVASGTATVRDWAAPENVERIVSALVKDGWRGPVGPRLVPRDEQAASDCAYAAALTDARRRATALAAADGRHIGRLLNVMPLPVDYFSSVLGPLAAMATAMWRFTQTAALPEIKQSAIFTFEFLP
jgi:uncharacterized protein YggE